MKRQITLILTMIVLSLTSSGGLLSQLITSNSERVFFSRNSANKSQYFANAVFCSHIRDAATGMTGRMRNVAIHRKDLACNVSTSPLLWRGAGGEVKIHYS